MTTLYRIVSSEQWQQAKNSGLVPRCAADERDDCVHLNLRQDVEHAADLWFSPEEMPLALELDVTSVQSCIRWELRTREPMEVWPNLYLPNLRTEQVIAVHRLVRDEPGGGFRFAAPEASPPAIGLP
ncbi:MAG: DUF952 domain-containing protein [Pseudomonadota bacterium]|nr:DUF952 domain-containing protein [Pseudomonadota bacterium]